MRIIEYQREVIATLREPSKHTSTERKRAYLFAFVYALGIVAFAGVFFHFISAWLSLIFTQLIELLVVVMYAFNLNDYSEKTVSSMECERSGNPLVDVYVAIRVIQLFQSIMIPSYIMLGCYSLLFAYTLFRMKRGKLYVDATNLWRDAKYFERESYILIAMDVVTIVICLIAMIFSFVNYYTD